MVVIGSNGLESSLGEKDRSWVSVFQTNIMNECKNKNGADTDLGLW